MMVKRNEKLSTGTRTDFQCYTDFSDKSIKNVVDWTDRRLVALIKESEGSRRSKYIDLLNDYRAGKVAIAWQGGLPLFSRLNKP